MVADFMSFSHHLPDQLRVRLDFFTDQEECRWRLAGLENREELFCLPWYWPIIEGQCNCLVGWGSGPQQRGSANLNIEGGRDHLLNPLFSLDHLIENKKAEDKKKGGGSVFHHLINQHSNSGPKPSLDSGIASWFINSLREIRLGAG